MKFRINWTGFYITNEKVNVQSAEEVQADSLIEALNACRSGIIQKLSPGKVFGLESLNPKVIDAEGYGFSMDELNNFVQSLNAEGGTDSVKRVRPKGYTATIKPNGAVTIETGNTIT